MDQGLGKKEKLKSKKTIDRLFTEGKPVKKFPVKLVYLPVSASEESSVQVAFSVPKRLVKTAVARNRIKRLMREVFRKNKYLVINEVTGSYAFMFIYISKEKTDYERLNKSMIKLLNTFMQKQNQGKPQPDES